MKDRHDDDARDACDACDGSGVALSGPCGCDGNGVRGMLLHVRQQLVARDAEIETLKETMRRDLLGCNIRLNEYRASINRRDAEIASLKNRLGDDLCHLQNPDTDPIPPKKEFLESCGRFWEQRSAVGVLTGCKTIAQLETENAELKAVLVAARELRSERETKS